MKKALIFDPYLDTLGGGEVYSLAVGKFLIKKNFNLEIAWPKRDILGKINRRFRLNFKNRVKINKKAFFILKQKGNLLKKYLLTKDYQLVFFLSDGSIPFLFAQKSWLHFQSPFYGLKGRSVLNQFKLKQISSVICNSFFTKKYIDQEYGVNSQVVYPPLSDKFLETAKKSSFSGQRADMEEKRNIILSVGRFDEILNSKRQDVLIDVFKKMVEQGLRGWQLVLLGGLMKRNPEFIKIEDAIKGYPIKVITNASFKTLLAYYRKSLIYWHAAGYGGKLEFNPQKAEHFGISIVEAMAAGCVPLVFNGGGVPEIIDNQVNGYLWQNLRSLEKITLELIKDKTKILKLGRLAKLKSKQFSKESFEDNLEKVLTNNEKNEKS